MRHQADPFPARAARHVDDLRDHLEIQPAIPAYEDVVVDVPPVQVGQPLGERPRFHRDDSFQPR